MELESTRLRSYQPNREQPWNLRRVVLLHRRAGFGESYERLERDLADGPDLALERMLSPPDLENRERDLETLERHLTNSATTTNEIKRLQAAWILRMCNSAHPLRERMTLIWHDHFATNFLKVRSVELMHAQNQTLRRHALGRFGDLLRAMLEDRALLVWLDAPANSKANPNENLARELLELFTLGVGNYTESDVRETARALTGWSVIEHRFRENRDDHDDGEKTILGQTARYRAPDVADLLLQQRATAHRLAWRLFDAFLGENVATEAEHDALARRLFESGLDLHDAVSTLLRSELFFCAENLDSRIASPVDYVVAIARGLELMLGRASSLALADWSSRLGQKLFLPPNVGGWKSGRAWIDTQAAIQRRNFAAAVASGALCADPEAWRAAIEVKYRGHGIANWAARALFGRDGSAANESTFEASLFATLAEPRSQIV